MIALRFYVLFESAIKTGVFFSSSPKSDQPNNGNFLRQNRPKIFENPFFFYKTSYRLLFLIKFRIFKKKEVRNSDRFWLN